MFPWFVQIPPLQLMNEAFGPGVAVTEIVVLFASEVPVGVCETVPGPLAARVKLYLVTVVAPVPVRFSEVPAGSSWVIATSEAARLPVACGWNTTVTRRSRRSESSRRCNYWFAKNLPDSIRKSKCWLR